MARPIRIEFPGANYHIIQRGFRRERILGKDATKADYMFYLEQSCKRFVVDLLAFCLMDNHVHLLIHTHQGNLSRFMHSVNASFANSRKRYRSLDGPVFAGRYKALLVDREAWLLQASLYIHLNPVRARMKTHVEEYSWSSAQDYLRDTAVRYGLIPGTVLALLDTKIESARDLYRQLLEENFSGSVELPAVHKGICYGDCPQTDQIDNWLLNRQLNEASPGTIPPLDDPERIIKLILTLTSVERSMLQRLGRGNLPRLLACYALREFSSLDMASIGDFVAMRYDAVAQSVRRVRLRLETDEELRSLVGKIRNQLLS